MKSLEARVAAVKMRNITKTFGSVVANNKVSLDLYKGEIVALLGENGAGKSTLMNVLAGVFPMDSGEITFDGQPLTDINIKKSEL